MVGIGFDQTPYKVPEGETFFNRTDGSAVLMVEQDIPNPGKLKAKYEYLSSLAAIDSADYGSLKNQMLTEAKNAYVDRYIAEKRLKVIDQQIALLNLMIQTDTSTYAVGKSDLASIYKTKARLHTMEAMIAHEKAAITEATAILNYLMNHSSYSTFSIDTVIPFKNYTIADFDTSTAYVSLHRSDIAKIDRSISSMQLNSSLASSAGKPDFSIRYEHMAMFGMPNQFTLVGSVTIPIAPWSSKSYKTEALSMQQQIDAMNLEKQSNINEARASMQQTLLHTIAEYEEVGHYEKQILPAYRNAVQSSLVAYRENTSELSITLLSWDDLNMAETEYLYHLEQAYKSEIAYENSIEKK